jgi:acetylglutamate kinase
MEEEAAKLFAQDVVLLRQSGLKPVIVHGGGKHINKMLERLNIKSEFKNGLRITTKEMAEVIEMVLAGHINKIIVDDIGQANGRAVGITGRDGQLMSVKKIADEALGFVGEPDKIDIKIIMTLLEAGIIPVVAPTGSDGQGQVYNVNADVAAGALAGALGATRLLMMTDVIGLMERDGSLIPSLSAEDARGLLASGVATEGMKPKIETCVQAVRDGVEAAVILDGRKPHALLLELFTPHGVGTMIQ